VTERLVVPLKPGNAGGGKGPQWKGNAGSDEDGGIGDESINPTKCSEVGDELAEKQSRRRGKENQTSKRERLRETERKGNKKIKTRRIRAIEENILSDYWPVDWPMCTHFGVR
jgi:hypothetical protein